MSARLATRLGLVMPIRIAALRIGQGDLASHLFLPGYADFQNTPFRGMRPPKANLSNNGILNQPFMDERAFTAGIHLHWNLPFALRLADFGDSASAPRTPPAPDRWLITRTLVTNAQSAAPKIAFANWVVESNAVHENADYSTTSIPFGNKPPYVTGAKLYRYIGRVFTLDEWLQSGGDGPYLSEPLTALGFGVPDFSSYYPNCRNVFGWCDTTLGVVIDNVTTTVSYSVTGWYSDPNNDPISGPHGAANAAKFGWLYDTEAGVPAYSLFHGVASGFTWDSQDTYFPDGAGSIAPSVAVGNTPGEAYAAYAANILAKDDLADVEGVLNALQLGLLPGLGAPGGLAALDEATFNQSFQAVDGGLTWTLKVSAEAEGREEPVSAEIPTAMAKLVATQDELNSNIATGRCLQGQIFLDWYKFMIARYNDPPAPQTTDVLNYVQLEISLLTQLAQDGETLTKAVSSLAAEIAEALPSGLTLAQVPADRFYAPADPVVLMTGDGVPSRPVDNAATIACELITDMASALNLPAGLVANSDAINLPCNVLPAPASGLPSPVDTAAALLQSDFLITPATAAAVTAAVAQLGGAGNPALLDFDTAAGAIAAAQRAFSNGSAPTNGISLLGSVPEPNIAYAPWSLPWSPVALSWRHIFYPTAPLQNHASKYAADVISDKFALSETSLNYLTDAPPVLNAFSVMTGTALLSSDATISVQSQVAQYLKYHTDAELQKIQADLGDSPVIAQSLSGFTAGMIMKTQALQLSIGDPCAEDPVGGSFSNQQVPAAVGGQNQFAPYATYPVFSEDPQFNAFRAGVVTLTDLILIDSFGRFQTVDTSNLIVADSFQPGPSANQWVLPPRISQPCQLKMTWLSGADASLPATGSAATNPICGWIVPNDLDDSLMYYNGDGTSIGSQTATAAGILWQAAPGAGAFSQTMAQSFGAHNTTLYAFAQAVAANGPSYLTGLLRTTSETRTLVSPASYQADRQAAVLIGTPLVLVQASLQLRAQGPLAPDQGFPALEADYARTGSPLRRTTHGLERIAFPVLLGQEISLDDGLIGFFLGSPGHAANFTTCYANKADGSCPDIVAPTTQTLQLTLGDAAPTLVAMLIDPRCSVHAFTGVNPVGALSLQSELYAQALSSLSFTFLASPVLAPAGAFAFPVPKESDGVWSWVVNSAGAWVEGAVATPSTTPTLQRSSGLQEGWLKLSPRKRGN